MSTARDANVSLADETRQAAALREAMVGELSELRAIRSERVAEAFRTVPSHLFALGSDWRRCTPPTAPSVRARIGGVGKESMLIVPSFMSEVSVWWWRNAGKCGISPRNDIAGAVLQWPGSWGKPRHRPILTD